MPGVYGFIVHMQNVQSSNVSTQYSNSFTNIVGQSQLPILPLFWENFIPLHRNQTFGNLQDEDDFLDLQTQDNTDVYNNTSNEESSHNLSMIMENSIIGENSVFKTNINDLSTEQATQRGSLSTNRSQLWSLDTSDTMSITSGSRAPSVISADIHNSSSVMQENIEKGIFLPPCIGSVHSDARDSPWLSFLLQVNKQAMFLKDSRSWCVDPLLGKDALYGCFHCSLRLSTNGDATQSRPLSPTRSHQDSVNSCQDVEDEIANQTNIKSISAQLIWLYRAPLYYSIVTSTDMNPMTARAHLRKIADRLQLLFKVHEQPSEFRYRSDRIHHIVVHTMRCANVKLWNPKLDLAVDKEVDSLKSFLKT